jgi:DNA-binding NarL/FixJ family response regulator
VTQRPGGRVLIIDDDGSARNEAAQLLASAGISASEAATGEDGLARARRERPALVILEVGLPRLSGYEVCRELRDEFGNDLPILFVSGDRIEPRDRVAGLELGADDYLAKPFHAGEFLARVRCLLKRSSVVAEPESVGLTEREREILQLLADGHSQAAIATRLVISSKTVGTHIQNILTKLHVHSRAQAVARAYRGGLVSGREQRSAPAQRG